MKYEIKYSKDFKKGLKRIKNDKKALDLVKSVIIRLANDEILEPKFNNHKLIGEYAGFMECHIRPNLLLIYKKEERNLILLCLALGSHSELFKK